RARRPSIAEESGGTTSPPEKPRSEPRPPGSGGRLPLPDGCGSEWCSIGEFHDDRFISPRICPMSTDSKTAASPADEYTPPRNPAEEALADIWREVLGVDRVSVHDDFFALGGQSLKATQVVSRIRRHFHVELPVEALFQSPTIADLAPALQNGQATCATAVSA